ncbi:MAG: protein-glutamate methylesterase/protein-glutamine glutaminase, partial [Chloroflexota bacterium]
FMRSMITKMLKEVPGLQVVDVGVDGEEAVQKVRTLRPDVVTMDVEMPKMNGLQALDVIMRNTPTPVIMLSSLTQQGAITTLEALEKGAVDFVGKPSGTVSIDIHRVRDDLVNKILRASKVHPTHLATLSAPHTPVAPVVMPAVSRPPVGHQHVVAIGTSTGGPKALNEVIPRLPANLPAAVLVVQHMPAGFTRALAQRLNDISPMAVREAVAGDALQPGVVLVAPGDFHMAVLPGGRIGLNQSAPVHNVRPAVDVLFASIAQVCGRDGVGVVLTGMGSDGAEGATAIKRSGGRVIAQDEATSVVFGMPRAVVEAHASDVVAPLPRVADEIVRALS